MEKFFDAIIGLVKTLLEKLLLDNPSAAGWALAFFGLLYGCVRLVLFMRGLQEKIDCQPGLKDAALKEMQARHDEKINAKDREIQTLNEKFHQQSALTTEAFQAVKDVLVRNNCKPHVLNLHNGIVALCVHAGLKPHETGMPAIND